MAGGGGAGLAGESGGEETVGGGELRGAAGAGLETGSSALATGFVVRESLSLRLPNTTALHAGGLLCPQFIDQGRQERTPRLFGLATACQPLRNLQKHPGGAMLGGDFRDHLAIVGSRAEYLRVERNRGDRLALDCLGEFAGIDFGPLRHADLIETVQRHPIVRPRCLQEIEYVLGIAQVGKVRRRDDQDIVRTDQSAFGTYGPLM